jgi:hypothetical protein
MKKKEKCVGDEKDLWCVEQHIKSVKHKSKLRKKKKKKSI